MGRHSGGGGGGGKQGSAGSGGIIFSIQGLTEERQAIVREAVDELVRDFPEAAQSIKEIVAEELHGKGGSFNYDTRVLTILTETRGNLIAFRHTIDHELGHAIENFYAKHAGGERQTLFQEAIQDIHRVTKNIFVKEDRYPETFAQTYATAKKKPHGVEASAMKLITKIIRGEIPYSDRKKVMRDLQSIYQHEIK